MINKSIVVSGKRKSAIAKATVKPGTGKVFINRRSYESLDFFKRLTIKEPIEITKKVLGDTMNYDIIVNVRSGGQEGQIQAARLAVARAIIAYTKSDELKKAFLKYDKSLLIADTRRKEAYKPGDSKARKKRQKSFR